MISKKRSKNIWLNDDRLKELELLAISENLFVCRLVEEIVLEWLSNEYARARTIKRLKLPKSELLKEQLIQGQV